MLFIEPVFLFVFLPATLLLFWLAARAGRKFGALFVLLLASILFYAGFGLAFLGLLLFSIIVNFVIGVYFAAPTPPDPKMAKAILIAGQLWNFGALCWFKYLGYFSLQFGAEGIGFESLVDVAIPAGISFYTFHQAVFLMDAYHRKPEVLEYLGELRGIKGRAVAAVRYAAFICFFPQLVIGPIVYLSEFKPSVTAGWFGRARRLDLEIGLTFIALGLFKKLILADNLATISSGLFTQAGAGLTVDPVTAWCGAFAYYFQLYFDFSGYSDMAVGLARLFGIKLPINFDSPLRATGIRDFYARWHMTLTRVIVRFVFTPLSLWGTRRGVTRRLTPTQRKLFSVWLPLIINFQIIALWHGPLATFLVFGIVHGVWAVLETEVVQSKRWKKWSREQSPAWLRLRAQLFTVVPLMLTFALFASPSLQAFGIVLKSMFAFPAAATPGHLGTIDAAYLILAAGIVWLMPNTTELMRRYRPAILTRVNPSTTPGPLRFAWRPNLAWALVIMAILLFCISNMMQQSPFLYQGF